MNVLSLFDGMSCGRVALDRANIQVKTYYASEIDKYATQVSQNNYPDIIRLGDINNWESWDIDWSSIDLILAGSPCQGFSFAGKQLAFDDKRSALFFRFAEILEHVKSLNPNVKFLLENVRMKKEFENVISSVVGVEPIMINSALVSAQNRKRLYWANWNVEQPEDKNILLKDIIHEIIDINAHEQLPKFNCHQSGKGMNSVVYSVSSNKTPTLTTNKGEGMKISIVQRPRGNNQGCIKQDKSYTLSSSSWEHNNHLVIENFIVDISTKKLVIESFDKPSVGYLNTGHSSNRIGNINHKARTIKSECGGGAAKMGQILIGDYPQDFYIRKLTPIECERLQTLPDNYTQGISNSQRYKMLGNGWTVDVIAHILRGLTDAKRYLAINRVSDRIHIG